MKRAVQRLLAVSRMGGPELRWRVRAHAQAEVDRALGSLQVPGWQRSSLPELLDPAVIPSTLLATMAAGRWSEAHERLSQWLHAQPQTFLIAPSNRRSLVSRIRATFPDAAHDAAERANRILDGRFDLLGYRGLCFSHDDCDGIDWHWDPVHCRRMPEAFWTRVAYLDPANGDHKIVWELNRQQHWLTLARAHWLTGEAAYRDRFVLELESWLRANPPLRGCNWASMLELALRAISWTWALNAFVNSSPADEAPWTIDLLLALDRQMDHIERNLSHYFSPNTHLLGEALALYVTARSLPFLRASDRRSEVGRQILVAEIDRQIAADGSHRERSSHYHRYTLDFYIVALAIARLTGDPAEVEFRDAVARLSDVACLLADSRGRLARFGDDDGGTALPVCGRAADDVRDSLAMADILLGRPTALVTEEALWVLAHPTLAPQVAPKSGETSEVTPASRAAIDMGYFVSWSSGGTHVVMHAGPHGYLNGGHAHADALSLTATIAGEPFLIDPGTGCYTADAHVRDWFRSTPAHNTVTVDGGSQSVPDGPFHWKRRAHATVHTWHCDDGVDCWEASHDGYQPSEHRRFVFSIHDDLLIVLDLVDGIGSSTIASHWHIDPRWAVEIAPGRAALSFERRRIDLITLSGTVQHFAGDESQRLGWHAPVYGRIEAGSTLRVMETAVKPAWTAAVFSLGQDNPTDGVERLDIGGAGAAPANPPGGFGLRIARRHSLDYALVGRRDGSVGSSRFGPVSTDARMCFCRLVGGRISRLSMVGGTRVAVDGSPGTTTAGSLEMVS